MGTFLSKYYILLGIGVSRKAELNIDQFLILPGIKVSSVSKVLLLSFWFYVSPVFQNVPPPHESQIWTPIESAWIDFEVGEGIACKKKDLQSKNRLWYIFPSLPWNPFTSLNTIHHDPPQDKLHLHDPIWHPLTTHGFCHLQCVKSQLRCAPGAKYTWNFNDLVSK